MDFKSLKRSMSEVYANIKASAEQGQIPDLGDCEKLSRLCRTMLTHAGDNWLTDAEDFALLSSQLVVAVKKKQMAEAILIAESLDDAQSYCHSTYKP